MREGATSDRIALALSEHDGLSMRNNVGVAFDNTGRPIRYGLMNESKKTNETFKSSDFIDCIPVLIQPHHVGRVFGLFTAIEAKATDWKYRPTDKHATAQLAFINLIAQRGGAAGFASTGEHVRNLLSFYR